MNILVLYGLKEKKPRKTILDSLYCFSRYDKENRYYYLNICHKNCVQKLIETTKGDEFSAVIIHYSMIACRYSPDWWNSRKKQLVSLVSAFCCPKIIIPQDEYNYNDAVKEFIKEAGVEYIFTCAQQEDYEKFYPHDLGYKHIETVFTGYVDEDTLQVINSRGYLRERTIDIGYRARKLPYWLGRHGQLKTELANRFIEYLESHQTGLVCDIANTMANDQNVIVGNEWIDFLINCRTMLGCLGGSGLLDRDGSIAKKVDEYCKAHPDATFDEVEEKCFKGKDNYVHLYALSPRHFECAMTKTCQLLVEGDYEGVFEPNIDYIEIKRDFSNLDEVIEKVKDREYCEKIAEKCYEDVVLSGKYTYANFVEKVKKYYDDNGCCDALHNVQRICTASTKIVNNRSILGIVNSFWCLFKPLENTTIYKIASKCWCKCLSLLQGRDGK